MKFKNALKLIREVEDIKNGRKEIIKRLKCVKCNKVVHASNQFKDDRFYCMICGMNLGFYESKRGIKIGI